MEVETNDHIIQPTYTSEHPLRHFGDPFRKSLYILSFGGLPLKLKSKTKWILAFALILIALYIISKVPLRLLSVFSVSQITLQAQGYEDPSTHEWKGSYWVIGLVTDTLEHYEGITYTFDDEEAKSLDANTIGEKTLIVNSEIKITIIPMKPYYERSMQYATYTVYPKTYGTWMNKVLRSLGKLGEDTAIPELKATVMQFTDESWKLYTPFKVQLYKNGVLKDEKVINTLGGTETIILTEDSPEETVKVQNLGKLGTGLGEPAFGNIIMFDPAHIFKVEGNIINEIKYDMDDYSYSNYWFGGGDHYTAKHDPDTGSYYPNANWKVLRWADGSPAHYFIDEMDLLPVIQTAFPVWGTEFRGVYRADTLSDYQMLPVKADIFQDKPKDNPVSGSPYGYSLVNYLVNVRGHRLYTLDDFDEYNQGVEIVDNKMRIYLPLSSFNNMVTVWISTEVADAIVYQPVPAQGVVTSVEWLAGGSISDKDVAKVTVKQEGSDGGRITVSVSGYEGLPISVSPTMDSVILDYGETYTFFFTVTNLGTAAEASGTLVFTATNDLGEVTSSKTLGFTILPQMGDQTILTVNLYDEDGIKPSGIAVTVNYGVDSQTAVSSDGYVTFNLGAYTGGVSVATQETSMYEAASASTTVQAGQNTVFMELKKKAGDKTILDLILEWLEQNYMSVAVILIVLAAAVYMARKR
jgi:hypothetical protein